MTYVFLSVSRGQQRDVPVPPGCGSRQIKVKPWGPGVNCELPVQQVNTSTQGG